MVRAKKGSKREVDYYEYRDGFKLITDSEIDAVIRLHSEKKWKKNELRVYAGMQEHAALHKSSKVDLYRVVNSETKKKGIKRLSHKEIDAALTVVRNTLPEDLGGQKKPVARKFLRYIAKGAASCSEAILLLYYSHQRIRQPKRYDLLSKGERFARFKYSELSALSGLRRATLCDGLKRLVNRGLINTVQVAKQNENYYGQLFIDGAIVSLTRTGPQNRPNKARRKISVTPSGKNRNATGIKTGTLKNKDSKTSISTVSSIRLSRSEEQARLRSSLERALMSPIDAIRETAERSLMELESRQSQAA